MPEPFDPYYQWLGIRAEEQPPNHYRLLGITPLESNLDVIAHAADRQMAHVRSFQAGKHSALSQQVLNEIAAARICLLIPAMKAEYDTRLQGELAQTQPAKIEDGTAPVNLGFDVSLRGPAAVSRSATPGRPLPWPILAGAGGGVLVSVVLIALCFSGSKKNEAVEHAPLARADAAQTKWPEGKPRVEPAKSEPPKAPTPPASEPPQSPPAKPVEWKPQPAPRIPDSPQVELTAKPEIPSPAAEPPEKAGHRVQAAVAAATDPQEHAADPASVATPDAAQRASLPNAAAQEQALKLVQETFRTKYDAATTPERQSALAKELLDEAEATSKDPAAQYVLLREAGRLAVTAMNVELAFQVIEAMGSRFAVDELNMKVKAVGAGGRSVKAAQAKDLVERILPLVEELVAKDQYDAAEQLGSTAVDLARKAKDFELLKRTVARNKQWKAEIGELRSADAQIQEATAVLARNATDPAANLLLGKHLCFDKGNWAKGLALLARGSDATLKDLAQRELKGATEPGEQAKLADAWWDLSENESDLGKKRLKAHAGWWYEQALAGLSGLPKAKAAARLEELAKEGKSVADASPMSGPRTLTNSIGMQFVLIPAGEFWMGSTPEEIAWATTEAQKNDQWILEHIPSEAPRHRVRISRPFYLGVYAVTQAEYQRVMGTNPSDFSAHGGQAAKVAGQDTRRFPVENVSWQEAVDFCRRLSECEKSSRWKYRLPTEAEWEYACRAGSTTKWFFGDDGAALANYAWFDGNSGGMPHPVGQKRPNAWGLYDMQGNVWQRCADWADKAYYAASPGQDPKGPSSGTLRVDRGGGWDATVIRCRSAERGGGLPASKTRYLGFRVCRVLADK
jgi:formylglycine-generating enzyme required for sulfatase activity